MPSLTYGEIRNPQFLSAFRSLSGYNGFPNFKTTRQVYELAKELDVVYKTIGDLHLSLVKKYAHLGERGEVLAQKGKPGSFSIPEDVAEAYRDELADFDKSEVHLHGEALPLSCLDGCPLSARDIQALEKLIRLDA